ncbi:hypothetical protein [Bradyrhizobium elkanii]|jgi:hypothetical protein|uniref:hypothetical protein n=1 Tax=Bradyrhizobium TaxID=374 RepID=UPI0004B3B144|nr:hypothetical protein [Bradyrhizobium elkanii]
MLDTRIHIDSNGQDVAVEMVQDVEPILEHNKMLRSLAQKSDWGRHVASIPNVIMTRWLNEELERGNTTIKMFGPEMDALVDRKLKDPEWAYLRTDSAQVQGFLGFGS